MNRDCSGDQTSRKSTGLPINFSFAPIEAASPAAAAVNSRMRPPNSCCSADSKAAVNISRFLPSGRTARPYWTSNTVTAVKPSNYRPVRSRSHQLGNDICIQNDHRSKPSGSINRLGSFSRLCSKPISVKRPAKRDPRLDSTITREPNTAPRRIFRASSSIL